MYLVTEEYDDGTFADEPLTFDTEEQGRNFIKLHTPQIGAMCILYRCYEVFDKDK